MPANAYGAPPQQPQQGTYGSLPPLGWQASQSSYGAPPAGNATSKAGIPMPALIGGAVVAGLVVVSGLGLGAWAIFHTSHRPLPVEAARLPSDTDFFQEARFPGADGPPAVRDAFLSSDIARHVCGAQSDFADRLLRLRTSPSDAVFLFDPKTLDARRATLECGQNLLSGLGNPTYTELVFHDGDEKKFLGVEIMKLKATELPAKYGFARQTFSGLPGYCLVSPKRTEPDFKWNSGSKKDESETKTEKSGECNDSSLAAFRDGDNWFFGQRTSVEAFARSFSKPRKELSTTIENLQLAFDSAEGLTIRRTDEGPKAAASLLKLPCTHVAYDSSAGSKFVEECLPKSVEKNASSIDAKVRAVTYELDAPIQDSEGIKFNLIFVARDGDAAKDVESELKDAARDWKSSAENDEAKLVKLVREAPNQIGQRKWSVGIDPFLRAVKNGTVSRSGRVVTMKLSEKFTDAERKELKEVMTRSSDDMQAAAAITQALTKGAAVPEASLAQIVGPEWASYVLAPRATDKDCNALRDKLGRFELSNPQAIPSSLRFAVRFKCEGMPLPRASQSCMLDAKDATAFGKCSLPTNPTEAKLLETKPTSTSLGGFDSLKGSTRLQ
jgi:hypothetical protein